MLLWTENIPRDVPFSLVCEQCDAGMEIDSYEQVLRKAGQRLSMRRICRWRISLGFAPNVAVKKSSSTELGEVA